MKQPILFIRPQLLFNQMLLSKFLSILFLFVTISNIQAQKVKTDNTPPTVSSINRQNPTTQSTNISTVVFRTTFSEPVTGVNASDFVVTVVSGSLTSTISGVTAVGTTGSTYDITVSSISGSGTLRLDLKGSNTGIADLAGNVINGGYTSGQTYIIDRTAPTVLSINRQNPTTQTTSSGSVVFRITFSEGVTGMDVSDFTATVVSGSLTSTISGVAIVGTDGSTYDVTVSSINGSGTLRLDLNASNTGISDIAGNAISQGYASGQTYIIDRTAPTVLSINGQSPTTQTTNVSSVVFRATFSKSVTGVDASDFLLTTVSGTITGTISRNAVTAVGTDGTTYDIAVSSISSNGTLRLDLKAVNTGIADLAGNAINGGYTSGQTYIIDRTAPTVLSVSRQNPTTQNTNLSSVVFRITFSEAVKGVDVSDFTATVVSGSLTSVIAGVNVADATNSTYDVTLNSISGSGTLRLDLKALNTGISDVAGNAIGGGYTAGQTYIFNLDQTAPTVSSINRQNPTTQNTNLSSVVFRVIFSKAVTGVDNTDFTITTVSGNVTGTIANKNAVAAIGTGGSTYDVTVSSISGSGTLRLDLKAANTGILDLAGNAIIGGYTTGQTYVIDRTAPTVLSINRQNPTTQTTNLSSVVFRATFSKAVTGVDASDFTATMVSGSLTSTISGVAIVGTDGSTYDVTVSNISGSGTLRLDLKSANTGITDIIGNAISGGYTAGQIFIIDKTAPTVLSINRQSPTTEIVNAISSVVFRVTFSEAVTGVDISDFTSKVVIGSITSTISGVSTVDATNATYDVTLNSITGSGTLRLDLNPSNTGIADNVGNTISSGYTSGQTYNVNPPPVGFTTVTQLNPLSISANTGEKPQAKVWTYAGSHWAVLANTTGTYLWRLDAITWVKVLKLSGRTTTKADCRVVGSVTHILLYQGPSSQFVSVEYIPSLNTYQLWSKRTATIGLTLDQGVETATIDMDGTGRMWLASAGTTQINVRWSDAPYSKWSAPITIYDGVTDDDICANIYMPVQGKMGVFWSNQNTKRFGFKMHSDGDDPSVWSNDEVPASQSALDNIGTGMADDHMNLAISQDGTLYCAVKTSYNSTGYPKISLLIRRPSGTWDNLYKISETGTRPIAILNEAINKLRIVYSSVELGGDILYTETAINNISFSPPTLLIKGGTYDNSTHSHQNLTSEVVILASDSVTAVGVLASDGPPTTIPATPVLASPINSSTAKADSPTLSWNAAVEAVSYQVQVSGSSDFTNTTFDHSSIVNTSVSVPGLSDGTVYFWRVRASNAAGSSNWSAAWSFTKAPPPITPLVGYWKMDEGSGNTLVDSSEYQNNGVTVNSPVWVNGKTGQALQLDGNSQYVSVPNNSSLNPTAAITLAAWIKPEKLGTQYVIKKAMLGGTDGYELALSSNGYVFFRLNQATSADNYRINSSTPYPTNGNTWMHIAATYDGTVMRLFINGIEEATLTPSNPISLSSNTLDLGIGAQTDGTGYFQGVMDEQRIYNTALTAAEIAKLVGSISNNPLVGNWKMDEGSGTTLIDSSDYENNGTIKGNPTWVAGKIGQALLLSGSGQYATVPNSNSLNPATAITLAAWIKPQKLGTQNIIKKAASTFTAGTTDGYELSLSSGGKVFFRINQATSGDTYRVTSIASYPTDGSTWMHIAATYDGTVMRLYINGVENATLTPSTPPAVNSNTLAVGVGAQSDGGFAYQGTIDENRIYNIALSADEIADLANSAPPATPLLASPTSSSTNIAINPTLTWNVAVGATTYQVQVSTVNDFSTTIFDQSDITGTSVDIAGLSNNNIYYWRVKASNAAGSSDWSAVWSFTTTSNNPLVGNWKMDEGSGTTLVDASEYVNNGTIKGSPVWVAGKIGQALQFNGTDQYATVTNNISLNPTTAITLTAWIRPQRAGTQYIIKKATSNSTGGTTDGYELSLSSGGKVFFRINQATSGDTYRVNSVTSYPTDGTTWMHIAATYDGTVMRLYINGVQDAVLTPGAPPAISTNTLVVGIGAQSNGASLFQGAIDEARIYNTALSAGEIADIVNNAPPNTPVLVTPSNNVSNVDVNPTLAWNTTAGATTYQVQVSAVNDFSTTVFDQSNITSTSVSVTGLSNSTVYYWRVRASNAVGNSDWSAVWSFTTTSNNSLVAYWKMDEGSGTTLVDASDYKNNGTTINSPVWVAGKVGQALLLNGTSQYATVPNSASLNPTTAITLAAWIRPQQLTTQNIIKKAVNGTTDGYELSLSSGGKVFFRINQATSGDTYRVNSVTSYPTDGTTWMHIAATYDGTVMRLYINGVQEAVLTPGAPPAISTNTLAVGIGAQSNGVSLFQGAIDEARIYNTALSAGEIANLATVPAIITTASMTSSSLSNLIEIVPKEKFMIYPNPTVANATVKFVLSQSCHYTLGLYDMQGVLVTVVKQGNAIVGEMNTVRVNGASLAKGTYLVKLQTNTDIKTVKLLIVR